MGVVIWIAVRTEMQIPMRTAVLHTSLKYLEFEKSSKVASIKILNENTNVISLN